MSDPASMTGHCMCGAVTVTVREPAGWLGVCHCRMCQRWSGGLFICFPAAESTVKVSGPVQNFASSTVADRAFCSSCGTHLWMRDRKDGADYDLIPGLFDATADWPLKSEIYHDHAFKALMLEGEHRRATAAAYRDKTPEIAGIGQ